MTNPSSITTWLDHLQALLPPSAITLVGAGKGTGTWAQWLAGQSQVPTTLVEAHPLQFAALQRQQATGNWPQASLLNTVIAPSAEGAQFFTASLLAESSLLPPEDLRHLWPNLHTVATQPQPAMALSALLQAAAQEGQQGQHWLLLDCLPAATLLRSAQAGLPKLDVVLARVLLTEGQSAQSPVGASLAEVAAALPDFIQLALQPSRHPSIAHVLFVRDYSKAKQAAEQAKAALQAQLTKAHADNAELLKKQELQAQAQQALQADLTKTIQARDAEAQAKQAAQQAQADLQKRLEQAQVEHQATVQRQQLLQDELLKAEAQLELIKELLLIRGDLAPDGMNPAV